MTLKKGENRMAKKTTQKSVKAILFITALFLLFFLPLKAEDKDHMGDRILIESVKPENKMNDFYFMSLGLKSFKNSELLQNENKEDKPYSTGLNFSQKLDESYPVLKKNPIELTSPKNIENSLFKTSLLTFFTLNVGDFYTTNKGLKYKSLKEANPLLRPLTKNTLLFAAVKLGITAINYQLLKKLYKKNKKLAWVVSIASNIVMGYVVVNNTKWIKYAQKNSY
jgi:heme/copper-type cytochrome/quinol oxidase subunit 3